MGQKFDIFKIWLPDFAQKNIYRILNLSKTISPKKFFLVKISIFEKNKFCAMNFLFFNITFDPNNQNTRLISFWKGF
jgi:hypothetical protein